MVVMIKSSMSIVIDILIRIIIVLIPYTHTRLRMPIRIMCRMGGTAADD